ncbi:hypothetical protein HK102_008589, partial [Quaeritorhiza haematococci]
MYSLKLKLGIQPKAGGNVRPPPNFDPSSLLCDASNPTGRVGSCVGKGACAPKVDFEFTACTKVPPFPPSFFDIPVIYATLTVRCAPGKAPANDGSSANSVNILPPSTTLPTRNPPNIDRDPVDTTIRPPADNSRVKIAPFVAQCPAKFRLPRRSKRSEPAGHSLELAAETSALSLPDLAPVPAPHLVKRLPNNFFITSGFFSSDSAQFWRNCLRDVQLFFFRDVANGGQNAGVEMNMIFFLPESGLTIELHVHMGNTALQPGAAVPITAVNLRRSGDEKGLGLVDGKPTSVNERGFRGLPPTPAGTAQMVNGGSNTFHGQYFGSDTTNRFNAIKSL